MVLSIQFASRSLHAAHAKGFAYELKKKKSANHFTFLAPFAIKHSTFIKAPPECLAFFVFGCWILSFHIENVESRSEVKYCCFQACGCLGDGFDSTRASDSQRKNETKINLKVINTPRSRDKPIICANKAILVLVVFAIPCSRSMALHTSYNYTQLCVIVSPLISSKRALNETRVATSELHHHHQP